MDLEPPLGIPFYVDLWDECDGKNKMGGGPLSMGRHNFMVRFFKIVIPFTKYIDSWILAGFPKWKLSFL